VNTDTRNGQIILIHGWIIIIETYFVFGTNMINLAQFCTNKITDTLKSVKTSPLPNQKIQCSHDAIMKLTLIFLHETIVIKKE